VGALLHPPSFRINALFSANAWPRASALLVSLACGSGPYAQEWAKEQRRIALEHAIAALCPQRHENDGYTASGL